ncbi:hypothetical protein SSP24_52930 [Streptomyces spinoverrucosus]|uniref:Uncharacterized protein n=1 Tax=Streptomyces spinoverrucosus TaxID=284043 RepID=A0A4Y3VN88_9ACTN|nr:MULTISPECIES: hypothetical protein [Streptomyces]MBX9396413.1 hypothetical protein [Streptomyces sp. TRM72054]GEC07638.1 hypothetical protein SSP24_52930 [Streptomyces spinoverrucosus]GHB62160.1 hypothetical protein GCM10010397_35170 [Streptomyces spinoverrucosus]
MPGPTSAPHGRPSARYARAFAAAIVAAAALITAANAGPARATEPVQTSVQGVPGQGR